MKLTKKQYIIGGSILGVAILGIVFRKPIMAKVKGLFGKKDVAKKDVAPATK